MRAVAGGVGRTVWGSRITLFSWGRSQEHVTIDSHSAAHPGWWLVPHNTLAENLL